MDIFLKKVKVAIAGLGNITHGYEDDPLIAQDMTYPTHLSVIKEHPGYELIAGCDVQEENLNAFSKKVKPSVQLFADYKEMLARTAPDLLVIATDTASHYDIGLAAIEQGIKGIFCEKPIAYSVKDARSLLEYADRENVLFAVNYFRAYDANYNKILNRFKKGEWGELHGIEAKFCGGVFNNATHLIDLIMRYTGEPVLVYGFPTLHVSSNDQDPIIDLYLKFHNGVNAYLHGFTGKDYDIFEIDFLFSKGRIIIRSDKPRLFVPRPSNRVTNMKELYEAPFDIDIDIGKSFYDVYNNLYDSFMNNNSLFCTAEDAVKSLKVVESGLQSVNNHVNVKQ